MTTRPRPHHDRKPEPADVPRPTSGPVPPGVDTSAVASQAGQDPPAGRLAYSVDEAARLTGLSRDLLYDEMRRGNLTYVKVGRRRLITRQHLEQFLDITASVQPPAQDPAAGHQAADDAPRPPARGQAHA
jgi:excisionase family DNA binding protein